MVAVTSNFSNRSANNGERANFRRSFGLSDSGRRLFLMAVVVREKVKDSLRTIDSLS